VLLKAFLRLAAICFGDVTVAARSVRAMVPPAGPGKSTNLAVQSRVGFINCLLRFLRGRSSSRMTASRRISCFLRSMRRVGRLAQPHCRSNVRGRSRTRTRMGGAPARPRAEGRPKAVRGDVGAHFHQAAAHRLDANRKNAIVVSSGGLAACEASSQSVPSRVYCCSGDGRLDR
jgi:hypothetical protein